MSWLGIYCATVKTQSTVLVDDVSFEIERGNIVAIFGANGSGKTTLLKGIAGILPGTAKFSGSVRLDGRDFLSNASDFRARHIAYVPSDLRAEFPITAQEAVQLGHISGDSGKRGDIETLMKRCFCWGLKTRLLHELSGGERQLVALARALAQGAKTILLDESLSKMDLNHQAQVGKLLLELKKDAYTVLLVSHDVNLATEWADSILILKNGKKVAYGELNATLTAEVLTQIYPGAQLSLQKSSVSGKPKVVFG